METIRVEILNPKALPILEGLADLKLISIEKEKPSNFADLLEKLRSRAENAPNLTEITKEVELLRRKRYGHTA